MKGLIFATSVLACLQSYSALAQEAQATTQRDIQLIDRLISDANFDVYLLRNGGVHSKGRYCEKLHTTTKGLGYYQTNRSAVTMSSNELNVSTAYKTKETYIAGGASGCNKPPFDAKSASPQTLSKRIKPSKKLPKAPSSSHLKNHPASFVKYNNDLSLRKCHSKLSPGYRHQDILRLIIAFY